MAEKFEATFESLRNFRTPDWFRDAKFGIWSHWGPQSVPMFGDWYARNMYIQGQRQYYYHIRHYGHPSKFGYKDICALWKAEKFDPDELMERFYRAGARYFVAQASHHDHFFNYDSDINRFNSVKIGPHRDICGEWKKAAQKYNLPFGMTEHLGASYTWWGVNKGCDKTGPYAGVPYDGNDPEYKDFYFDNYIEDPEKREHQPWYTSNEKFHEYWLNVMKEIVDKYTPDLLYSDGGLPFVNAPPPYNDPFNPKDPLYKKGLEAVAYLYNKSIEIHGENRAVYTQKDRREEVYTIGVLDIEKSQLPDILPYPWQTDTCIGNWFYDVHFPYKEPGHIVEMLVDIISKNGTMLLNILQRPDGSLDDDAVYILDKLEEWFKVCGEGVYGTRPWKVSGEGTSKVVINGFREERVKWEPSDFRFVQKNGALYAFVLKAADNRVAVIKSLDESQKVEKVTLLGHGEVPFTQAYGVLNVKLPGKMPVEYANCLKIEGKNITI